MITESAGSPTVSTMAAPPAVVPPVADPSVYIVTWAFVNRINCKLMFDATACRGGEDYAHRVDLPVTLASSGTLTLVLEGFSQGQYFKQLLY